MKDRERSAVGRPTPVGKAVRAMLVGTTMAKVSAKKIGLLSKRPFLSPESLQQAQIQHDDEVAEALFHGLSTLRGGALKLAQLISLEADVLPERYRKELFKAHYQVPPLNRAVVRRVITSELGKPPEEIFRVFEPTAFAAASLGQVHRARSPSGERLAVKVQYPGIGTALKNDVQLLRQVLLPFMRSEYLVDVARELDRRLADEVDYGLERRMTQWFHEYGQIPGVVVPRTFERYSSALVLTTEFMEGRHLDRWLETSPSQARRDQAAQLIYDFFTRSFAEHCTMHSDPNPGNYLFRDDGTVAVIDFGSSKAFTPMSCHRILTTWHALIRNDRTYLIEYYCAKGMAKGNRKLMEEFYDTSLAPLREWMSLPYTQAVFDFGRQADYCAEGARLMRDIAQLQVMNGFDTEGVLFYRNMYGLYRLFSALKARVRFKNRWIF